MRHEDDSGLVPLRDYRGWPEVYFLLVMLISVLNFIVLAFITLLFYPSLDANKSERRTRTDYSISESYLLSKVNYLTLKVELVVLMRNHLSFFGNVRLTFVSCYLNARPLICRPLKEKIRSMRRPLKKRKANPFGSCGLDLRPLKQRCKKCEKRIKTNDSLKKRRIKKRKKSKAERCA